jgi:hypothetical protein
MPTIWYFLRIAEGVKPVRSKSPAGAGIEDDQILRIENDPGRIALSPFDAQMAPIGQHGTMEFPRQISSSSVVSQKFVE